MFKFTKTNLHYTGLLLLCLYVITIFFGDFKYPVLSSTLVVLACIVTLIEEYKFRKKSFIPFLVILLTILAVVLILYNLKIISFRG